MISVPLWLTAAHPCSYLSAQTAQTLFVHPAFTMNNAVYAQLLAQGFRRNGDEVYRPHCTACNACIPVRIPVASFQPNRSQKRCLLKNHKVNAQIKSAAFEPAHYELYLRYQRSKHPDSNMQYASANDYRQFLNSSWCNSAFVEFRLLEQLFAVAVIDYCTHGLSAVYTFFAPEFAAHSPGVYAILWQIQYARQLNLPWLYLGYWLADCQKMRYKAQYQPLEMWYQQQWQPFAPDLLTA